MARFVRVAVAAFLLLALAGYVHAACGDSCGCSRPIHTGANPTASDCLLILRAAVGSQTCTPACICDTNGDHGTTATDALICLKFAVGQDVPLACPCDTSTTVTTTTFFDPTTSTTSTTAPPTSSTSSSTTTSLPVVTTTVSTVTTTTSTTTTTTLLSCTVRFRLASAVTIADLLYDTKYQLIFGVFAGSADGVECTPLAQGVFQFNDDDAFKILTTGYTNDLGLAGPTDLVDCTYQTNDAELAPGDFQVIVNEAHAPDSSTVDATMEISSVTCD